MNIEKVAQLVKLAKMNKEERNRKARARYRNAGPQMRRQRKLKQRVYRRQGGQTLKTKVKMQNKRLEHKATRIRKEPLQKRLRDTS